MKQKICKDRTGEDKGEHGVMELLIAGFVGTLMSFIHFPHSWIASAIAFAVAIGFGIWKERRDGKKKWNHFCVWDLLWDTAGALAGAVYTYFAHYYTWHNAALTIM